MDVLITGGAGFLGRRLASRLLHRGTLRAPDDSLREIDRLTLLDTATGPRLDDPRVEHVAGDMMAAHVLDEVITPTTTSIFHLAAVVSGMAEADFDIGMRVNVDASRRL